MYTLWLSRNDLKNVFSDILGKDRLSFCHWFIDSAEREYGFTNDYIDPVKNSLAFVENDNNQIKTNSESENLNTHRVSFARKIYSLAIWAKPLLIKIVPTSSKEKLKKLKEQLQRKAYPPFVTNLNNTDRNQTAEVLSQGINLIGYSRSQTGVGESCRLAAQSLNAANVPFGIINYNVGNPASNTDNTWVNKEIESSQYNVNVFHINADQMPVAYAHLGSEVFENRYNIGYWHWELPDFPEEWKSSFQFVNEIWVPSQFIMDCISKKSPVPVVKIPHGISLNVPIGIGRESFKLPEKQFLFLTMYDAYSYQERKNPNAVIDVFKKSFDQNDATVGLVIKVNHSKDHPEELKFLEEKIKGYKNIYILAETMSREKVNALINSTDCFVSLHRSEGFGLGLAEAMYLGKPVVGTNWSANIDFMNVKNSCVVDFELVQLGKDYGPYKAYQSWANPDLDHAVYYMRRLVSDPEYYQQIASLGQQTIKNDFSPEAVGKQAEDRLRQLGLL
ncbi:glycosyltransferase [Paenibacillus sp. LMG 31461]|uniref:Glycosyltransferase n=2 Tax=Paenibacillus plantarum TaxID=2654975 RepID=A0ABX1XCN9_9BACL|nr:glycosyltransferase [Paenibacillus plantarum]